MALGAVALAYPAAQGQGLDLPALLGIGGAGLALVLAGLVLKWRPLVALALLPLSAPVAVVLALRGPIYLAPVLGALLLVATELDFWSIDEAVPGPSAARLRVGLTLRTIVMAVLGLVMGLVVLALVGLRATGGLDLTLIGSLAAVGVLALAVWLLRASLGASEG